MFVYGETGPNASYSQRRFWYNAKGVAHDCYHYGASLPKYPEFQEYLIVPNAVSGTTGTGPTKILLPHVDDIIAQGRKIAENESKEELTKMRKICGAGEWEEYLNAVLCPYDELFTLINISQLVGNAVVKRRIDLGV